jgi:hypothetical protein
MNDIEKMKKQIEEMKAARVARGLPPSPPEAFVPPEIGFILLERCKPLFDILAKYTKLCDNAQAMLPIDTSKFDTYMDDLTLLGETTTNGGTAFSVGLKGAINTIKKHGDATPDKYVRLLLKCLQLAGLNVKQELSTFAYDYRLDSREQGRLIKEVNANYEQYKSDEALLNVELKKLMGHYESIKHLY